MSRTIPASPAPLPHRPRRVTSLPPLTAGLSSVTPGDFYCDPGMGSISIIQRVAVGENIPQINDGSVNPIIPGLVNPFSPRGLGSQLAGVVDL